MSANSGVTPSTYYIKCFTTEVSLLIWYDGTYYQGIVRKKFNTGTIVTYRTAQFVERFRVMEQFYNPCSST